MREKQASLSPSVFLRGGPLGPQCREACPFSEGRAWEGDSDTGADKPSKSRKQLSSSARLRVFESLGAESS